MIKPAGHRLVVKPFKQEEVDEVLKAAKKFGFEIVNENKKREDASVDQGVVLAIGPTAWQDFKSEPWCKKGDTILFAKFSGKFVTDPETNEDVVILNDEDVVAVITEGTE
jgi:co-chaperonin GroES (HSP10)